MQVWQKHKPFPLCWQHLLDASKTLNVAAKSLAKEKGKGGGGGEEGELRYDTLLIVLQRLPPFVQTSVKVPQRTLPSTAQLCVTVCPSSLQAVQHPLSYSSFFFFFFSFPWFNYI